MKKLSCYNVGLTLLIVIFAYGYLCRIFNIYFFWESKYITIFIFFVLVVILVIREIVKKTRVYSIIILLLMSFGLYNSINEFCIDKKIISICITYIKSNREIRDKIGDITGVSMIREVSPSDGDYQIEMIVKGKKKYKDISLHLFYKDKNNKTIENLFVWRYD